MDISLVLLAAPILLPLIGIVCVLSLLIMGRPIFFRQTRPGTNGKPFSMLKFRTMTDKNDENGKPFPDHIRLTHFGRFLRSSSLDELPELWNVLNDDMSLVGPRPLLMEYLPLYSDEQKRRHDVKPGITGWAQVKGRNLVPWEERFILDVWYVDNRTVWLDMKIILMTILKLFKREGIHAEGHATMPLFKPSLHKK